MNTVNRGLVNRGLVNRGLVNRGLVNRGSSVYVKDFTVRGGYRYEFLASYFKVII